jgi:hypothetical protein
MKAKSRLPKPITKLSTKVNNWRAKRKCLCPMPEELWSEAVVLAKKYGISPVARGAGLAHDSVKRRVNGDFTSKPKTTTKTKNLPLNPAFIELPMSSLSNQETESAVLELRDAQGRLLTVRISANALSKLSEVATTLWSLS